MGRFGELRERLNEVKLAVSTTLLLILITPVGIAQIANPRGFIPLTVAAYLADLVAVIAVGRVARARRARRFFAPSEAGSVGEVRLLFASLLALGPLAALCARAWLREGRLAYVAGAAAVVGAVVAAFVRAFRRFCTEP
jgi:hypothetical protein